MSNLALITTSSREEWRWQNETLHGYDPTRKCTCSSWPTGDLEAKTWTNFRAKTTAAVPRASRFLCSCRNKLFALDKHLMTGPDWNSKFCFPETLMFPEAKPRATLRSTGNKTHRFPRDQSLSVLFNILEIVCFTSTGSQIFRDFKEDDLIMYLSWQV